MQENSDQKALSQDEAGDLRTSNGEVVRRVDLDRAAGTPGRFRRADPDVAGYKGVELARTALAGDQAALDEFHELVGLTLPGVTEYVEGDAVRIVMRKVDEKVADLEVQGTPISQHGVARAVFQASNENRNNCTCIDASELVAWVLSPEGRAALARRGVTVPATTCDERMSVATSALASIANVLGVEDCPTPWIENTRDAVLTEIRRRADEVEAEELDLQEGDVVTLTVGGNQMTVIKVHGEGQHFGQIAVAWFASTTLHRDAFEKAALVRVSPSR